MPKAHRIPEIPRIEVIKQVLNRIKQLTDKLHRSAGIELGISCDKNRHAVKGFNTKRDLLSRLERTGVITELIEDDYTADRQEVYVAYRLTINREKFNKLHTLYNNVAEVRRKFALLYNAYQTMVAVIEVFCKNPECLNPTINNHYAFLYKLIRDIIDQLGISGYFLTNHLDRYTGMPFKDLHYAEHEYGTRVRWDYVRRGMSTMLGQIEAVYNTSNAASADMKGNKIIQNRLKMVFEVRDYITGLLESTKEKKKQEHTIVVRTAEPSVEVTPGTIAAGEQKREPKFPYKLPAGTNWQDIFIKFIDEENVLIKVKNQEYNTDYNELGLVGHHGKGPSVLWTFLKVLAEKSGEISINDEEAKDTYKKQKQQISYFLKRYFSIDYDPFYPYNNNKSYKIKIMLIPPPASNNSPQFSANKVAYSPQDDPSISDAKLTSKKLSHPPREVKK